MGSGQARPLGPAVQVCAARSGAAQPAPGAFPLHAAFASPGLPARWGLDVWRGRWAAWGASRGRFPFLRSSGTRSTLSFRFVGCIGRTGEKKVSRSQTAADGPG